VDWQLIENAAPILLTLGLALSIPITFIILSSFLGPRKPSSAKRSSYECGLSSEAQVGDARSRFGVRFYLVAICFLVFDVEVAFLFPWAVWFRNQGVEGLAIMGAFLGVLAFGWFYMIRRGALEWD
jgi:NADH-quinone oxidoreductase subunit A